MIRQLVFDMDGTLYDLYSVPNWLSRLRAEDPTPYLEAHAMWDIYELKEALKQLSEYCGWHIAINSWLSMGSSQEYKRQVRRAKRAALARDGLDSSFIGEYHFVAYGTPKSDPMRMRGGILVDDNAQVRAQWERRGGLTIDPTACDLIDVLFELIRNEEDVIRWLGGESYYLH